MNEALEEVKQLTSNFDEIASEVKFSYLSNQKNNDKNEETSTIIAE
jgi:hypothetical protein